MIEIEIKNESARKRMFELAQKAQMSMDKAMMHYMKDECIKCGKKHPCDEHTLPEL